ncbi:hypothetical protein ACFL47_07170 [Candidatus Latescibacterota bacterium]
MYIHECWKSRKEIDIDQIHSPVKVTLPARFDFIGGWTDTPPYHFKNAANVLNATLDLTVNSQSVTSGRAITITVEMSDVFTVVENDEAVVNPDDNLIIRNTLEFLDIRKPQIALTIDNTIPKGSGLGGSSLMVASLLAALFAYYHGAEYVTGNLNSLINNVLYIEQLMESGGGWQDQIGGLFPGIKLIGTTPEEPCTYDVSYINSPCEGLSAHSLIIDTRIQRRAARILYSIRQKYVDGDPGALAMLTTIAENARRGFSMLSEDDIRGFAGLLSESWRLVNKVENGTVEAVDAVSHLCGDDIIGMKMGGAGGGGFILVIFDNEDKKRYYTNRIRDHIPGCIIYNPRFGGVGMTVEQEGRKVEVGREGIV